MKVSFLKKLLEGVSDDSEVLIPVNEKFDGVFYTPCNNDSGVDEAAINIEGEYQPEVFILVPCGYFSESEEEEE